MQTRLDRITLTVANRTDSPQQNITYAPETEELRLKRYILSTAEAAVPTTQDMYQAMSQTGERVVLAIERYILQENNNRLNFSCNDIAGLTLQIPDLVGTQPGVSRDWPIYEENFDFEEPNEPEIVIYLLPSSQPFVGHAAVVAYNHPVDPLLNIVAQSDGNAVSSGIFFTHVKDSQHYRTENPPMFGE